MNNYIYQLQLLKSKGLEDVSLMKDGKPFEPSICKPAELIGTYLVGFDKNNKAVEVPFVDVTLAVALEIMDGHDKVRYTEARPIEFEEGGYLIRDTAKGEFSGINYRLKDMGDWEFNYWNPIVKDEILPVGHVITYYDGKSFLV